MSHPAVLTLVCLLPASRLKNALLRAAGHSVSPKAQMAPCLVWQVGRLEVGKGASIGRGNIIRDLTLLHVDDAAKIGRRNWISGAKVFASAVAPRRMVLGRGATVGSRHYLDATGGLTLEHFAALQGERISVLTHGVDFMRSVQTAGPVTIGEHSIVESHCTVLADTIVQDRVVVGAGSLVAGVLKSGGFYAGGQARRVREIDADFFHRTEGVIRPADAPGAAVH